MDKNFRLALPLALGMFAVGYGCAKQKPDFTSSLGARQECTRLLNSSDMHSSDDFWRMGEKKIAEGRASEGEDSKRFNLLCALAAFEGSTVLAPRDPTGYLRSGHLYFEFKDFKSALKAYEKALSLRPNLPEVNLRLAQIYRLEGKPSEAQHHLSQELNLNPTSSAAWSERGEIAMSSKDFHLAVESYKVLVVLVPEDERFHLALATAERKSHKFESALATLDRMEKLPGRRPSDFYFEKGLLLREMGRRIEAVSAFKAYLESDRSSKLIHSRAREKIRRLSSVVMGAR